MSMRSLSGPFDYKRFEKALRGLSNLPHSLVEDPFICLRRFAKTADLANELKRCGLDLLLRGRNGSLS